MHRSTSMCLAGILAAAALLGGCASTFPAQNDNINAPSAEFEVAPKEMIEKIRTALSTPPMDIGIAEQEKGSLVTGYQRFPGEWHIGRRWQEQTRYRIIVIPDFDRPMEKCTVEVREVTQTRAAEGMKWEPTEIDRGERAQAVLDHIGRQVGG